PQGELNSGLGATPLEHACPITPHVEPPLLMGRYVAPLIATKYPRARSLHGTMPGMGRRRMAESIRRFAIVGLGKMGGNLAQHAMRVGYEVVGVDPKGVSDELTRSGVKPATLTELAMLPRPRIVMLYVPAGPAVDQLLSQLSEYLESGDII